MNAINALFFIVTRFIGSCLLGILFVIIFAPYGSALKTIATPFFKSFLEHHLGCHVSFQMLSCTIINPCIELADLEIHPPYHKQGAWTWRCKQYTMGFSWLRFLKTGKLELSIAIDRLDICSAVINNRPTIQDHLEKLLQPSAVIYVLKFLNLEHTDLFLYDHARQIELHLTTHSSSRKIDDTFKSKIHIVDGTMSMYGKPLINNIVATLATDLLTREEKKHVQLRLDGRITTPINNITYFLSGRLEDQHGRFSMRTADNECTIDPIIINQKDQKTWLQLHAQVPLEYIQSTIPDWSSYAGLPPIKGLYVMRLCAALDATISTLDAYLLFDNLRLNSYEQYAVITSSIHKRDHLWTNETSVRLPSILEIKGNGSWQSDTNQFSCSCTNLLPIFLMPHWHLETAACQLATNTQNIIEGSFLCKATHNLIPQVIETDGTIVIEHNTGTMRGKLGNETYEIIADSSFPFLKQFRYGTLTESPCAQVTCSAINQKPYAAQVDGAAHMTLINSLLERIAMPELQTDGLITFKSQINTDSITACIASEQVTIRLPHTYNIAKDFSGNIHYNLRTKRLTVTDLVCLFDQGGTITLPYGIIDFDVVKNPTYICAPVIVNQCLFNIHHDLFARISGSLLLQQLPNHMRTLSGHIIIDKSQLKENILAETLQQKLRHHAHSLLSSEQQPALSCNITLETKDPMQVKTDFLDAQATTKLCVKGTIANPEISGNVRLLSGNLIFPYKPLYITKGSLLFMPEQSPNPLIELTAKNTIKKHAVTLHVTGSLHEQHLLFESTPPLSEEQIISLLFVGSAQDSLNVMAPALLMNNMQKLMFGTSKSSILDRYFKSFVKPFSIHLVPSFADQTGRGGLRGALEIDVNDRLRATIQKNFSLSEDTRFEIEYAATEDITIRGIRNERRDLGGEVELRWKF